MDHLPQALPLTLVVTDHMDMVIGGNPAELGQREINGNTEYFLMPGQRAVVTGTIQLLDVIADRDRVNFWAGLIHEHVRIDVFNDHVDPQPIVIGF